MTSPTREFDHQEAFEIIGIGAAARLLEISEISTRKLAADGKLPFTWIAGRRAFRRDDVLALARKRAIRRAVKKMARDHT